MAFDWSVTSFEPLAVLPSISAIAVLCRSSLKWYLPYLLPMIGQITHKLEKICRKTYYTAPHQKRFYLLLSVSEVQRSDQVILWNSAEQTLRCICVKVRSWPGKFFRFALTLLHTECKRRVTRASRWSTAAFLTIDSTLTIAEHLARSGMKAADSLEHLLCLVWKATLHLDWENLI